MMQIATVLGVRGSGKSTALAHICSKARRMIIVDTNGEHADKVDNLFTDPVACAEYLRNVQGGAFRVAFAPSNRDAFEAICAVAWEMGKLLFVIDELDLHTEPGWVPESLYKILTLGRHRQIVGAATVRRPADMPRAWTAASDQWIVFRVLEPRDLEYLKKVLGQQAADMLPRLERFNALHWSADSFGEMEVIGVKPGGKVHRVNSVGRQ